MNLYKIIYCNLYKFVLKTPSRNEQPEHIASIVLTLLVCFNLFLIAIFLEKFDVSIASAVFETNTPYIVAFFLTSVLNYFYLIRGNKHQKMLSDYNVKSKKRKRIYAILVMSYILLTIVLAVAF